MEWNVYYHDINSQEIKLFNVFNHGRFYSDIEKHLKKYKDKKEFAEALKRDAQYYFWSKAEWELIIEITEDDRIFLNPWVGCKEPDKVRIDMTDDANFDWRSFAEKHIKEQIYGNAAKIDVFSQLYFVWNDFVDYCWNSKMHRPRKKKNAEVVGDADQSGLAPAT